VLGQDLMRLPPTFCNRFKKRAFIRTVRGELLPDFSLSKEDFPSFVIMTSINCLFQLLCVEFRVSLCLILKRHFVLIRAPGKFMDAFDLQVYGAPTGVGLKVESHRIDSTQVFLYWQFNGPLSESNSCLTRLGADWFVLKTLLFKPNLGRPYNKLSLRLTFC
jgi:hypothetical protein